MNSARVSSRALLAHWLAGGPVSPAVRGEDEVERDLIAIQIICELANEVVLQTVP